MRDYPILCLDINLSKGTVLFIVVHFTAIVWPSIRNITLTKMTTTYLLYFKHTFIFLGYNWMVSLADRGC